MYFVFYTYVKILGIPANLKLDYLKNENNFEIQIRNIFPCFASALF